jgi:hypothetical protein
MKDQASVARQAMHAQQAAMTAQVHATQDATDTQLQTGNELALTSFEDSLAREYREIARNLPVAALLGEPGPEPGTVEFSESLPQFYSYFDLSNEQAFLQNAGRVRAKTWDEWKDGITGNLSKPQFAAAWRYIHERAAPLGEFDGVAAIWSDMAREAASGKGEDGSTL